MNGWRVLYGVILLVAVFAPLLTPFREIVAPATWTWSQEDGTRLRQLASNTITLSGGALVFSFPVGLALAVLLFRTSFFGRRFLLMLLTIALFVPLPIIVSSWQGAFGADGWLPLAFMQSDVDRPWATGMTAAIVIHGLAAIPWITFIIGIGLSWTESELEDEAAQSVGAWRVLVGTTLPRVRASLLAAALFVVLQTAGEISVTDMMIVGTLAEETVTQFAINPDGLGRTLALSLPALVLTWGAVLCIVAYLERTLPPLAPSLRANRVINLGPSWLRLIVGVFLLALLLAPLGSLVWKLGLVGHPSHWSFESARQFLTAEARLLGKDLWATFVVSLLTGMIVAAFALTACWLAREARWFRWLLFTAATGAWVIPGPVVGIGLHEIILSLPKGPWKDVLYYGPSPLPLMWVQSIRALPMAVIFLWPIVRMIPREISDDSRLIGANVIGEWFVIVLPMTWRAALAVMLVSAALCLAEVSASTRVETPGWESFTKLLFDRMHYGVDNNVAALAVLMLGSVCVVVCAGFSMAAMWRVIRERY